MTMTIRDVFENAPEGVGQARAKLPVTIRGADGHNVSLMPGATVGAEGAEDSVAGVTGQWIIDHFADEVPATWTVTPLAEIGGS